MTIVSTAATASRPTRRSAVQRIWAISRAEILLYLRKPLLLLPALFTGPVMVLVFGPMLGSRLEGPVFSAFLVESLTSWALLMVVYYNTTLIAVSRRNEGVYQRMATGQASSWEAFIAACLPSAVIVVVQILLGAFAAAVILFPFPFPNLFLVIFGIVGGIVFLTAAAAWTSSWTNNIAAAQYTTLPLIMFFLPSSGTVLPLGGDATIIHLVFSLTPLHAVNDLVGIGMVGSDLSETVTDLSFLRTWGATLKPSAVLVAWVVGAVLLARSTMRFNRRR